MPTRATRATNASPTLDDTDLDAEVRARFVATGVRNIRNHAGPEGGGRTVAVGWA